MVLAAKFIHEKEYSIHEYPEYLNLYKYISISVEYVDDIFVSKNYRILIHGRNIVLFSL